jgi:hypothetical protein
LNGFDIVSKEFSPFYEQASQCRLGYIDFFTKTTPSGQFSSDIYIDTNLTDSLTNCVPHALNGSNVVNTCPDNTALISFQPLQKKIWHRLFVQSISQNFAFELSLSDEQMANGEIDASQEAFELYAIAMYLSQNARLVQ